MSAGLILACCTGRAAAQPSPDLRVEPLSLLPPLFVPGTGLLPGGRGPARGDIAFFRRDGNMAVYLQPSRISFVASRAITGDAATGEADGRPAMFPHEGRSVAGYRGVRVDLEFVGCNPSPVISALDTTTDILRCYAPSRPEGAGIPLSTALRYRNLYDGIDLVVRSLPDGLKYEFRVAPGADPSSIRLRWNGADTMQPDAGGGVLLTHAFGTLRDAAPRAWHSGPHGATDTVRCVMLPEAGVLRFAVAHDPSRELVIDPFVQWSTYYGGASSDYARDVAVDARGNIWITGYTTSSDFPLAPGAFQTSLAGTVDAFLVKFTSGRERLWATYYGGSGEDEARNVEISADGGAILAGSTSSSDFPLPGGAFQPQNNGGNDAFILRFDADGNRVWGTLFGGGYSDECTALALDGEGSAIIAGGSYSTNLPVTKNALQVTNQGEYDGFIAKFSAAGKRLWATYIGGWGADFATSVATDRNGGIAVTGCTESLNFPAGPGAQQNEFAGGKFDAFLMKLGPAGQRVWSTYLGGRREDKAACVTIDHAGNMVVSGYTESGNFPSTEGAWQALSGGGIDAFLAQFSAAGRLVWSTFLGDDDMDIATCHAQDPSGNILLTGYTRSARFPVSSDAVQLQFGGATDAFLARFTGSGTRDLCTCIGGREQDLAYSVASDDLGNTCIVGATASTDFPTAAPLQNEKSGFTDVFLCRLLFNLPLADAGNDTSVCRGSAAVIGRAAAGGRPPYTYVWTPDAGLRSASGAQITVQPDETTVYTMRVTDAEGSISSDQVAVTVNPLPHVTASEDVELCPGASAQLAASVRGGRSPYTIAWRAEGGSAVGDGESVTVAPASTTTYIAMARDANGCEASEAVTVTVHPPLLARAEGGTTICSGAVARLHCEASGGAAPYSYVWSPETSVTSPQDASVDVSPQQNETYTVTVTDANGCTISDRVAVQVLPPLAVATDGDRSVCPGVAARIIARTSGGRPPYRASWSPSEGIVRAKDMDVTVQPRTTTAYTVTVTDALGCTRNETVTVTVHPALTAHAGDDVVLCTGTAAGIGAEAEGGLPPYTYVWYPESGLTGAATPTPAALPSKSTRYTVTVTDAAGCVARDTVLVGVFPPPRIAVDPDFSICRGSRRKILATVKGGKAPYFFQWSPAEGLSATNVSDPVATPDSTITYSVTVVDANGCRSSGSVTVTVRPCNKAEAGPDAESCRGSEISIGAEAGTPARSLRYAWSPAAGLSSPTVPNPLASPAVTTTYVLRVTNEFGCEDEDTVVVLVHPAPTADAGVDATLCEGGATRLGRAAEGGMPPYTYAWEPAAGLDRSDIPDPIAAPARTTTYTVTVRDARGCTDTRSVDIAVSPLPQADAGADRTLCSGTELRLSATSITGTMPLRFAWYPSEGMSDAASPSPTITPVVSTAYTVSVTSADGCQDHDTVQVTVQPSPQPRIAYEGNTQLCEGDALLLSVDGSFASYRWSNGAETPFLRVDRSGSYTLTVRDENGCAGTSAPVEVTVTPLPRGRIVATGPQTICAGESVALDAGAGFSSYEWSTLETTRSIRVAASGSYTVRVTNPAGCAATLGPVDITVRPAPLASIDLRGDTLRTAASPGHQWLRDGRPLRGATEDLFIARESGSYSVVNTGDGGCRSTSASVAVRIAALSASAGSVAGAAGDTLRIPVIVTSSEGLPSSAPLAYDAELRLKKKSAIPLPDPGVTVTERGDEYLVRLTGEWNPAGDPAARELASFRCVLPAPARRRAARIPVVFERLGFPGRAVRIAIQDGEIRVVRAP